MANCTNSTQSPVCVEACHFTPGGYGNCFHCFAADQCPTYQDTGLERALVREDDPLRGVVGVG